MKGKIMLLAGGAIGYVLGTRAGRERYDQIVSQVKGVAQNPTVQEKAAQAQELAKQKAPVVKDKVAGATSAAKDKVSGGGDSDSSSTDTGTGTGTGTDADVVVEVVEVEPAPYPSTGV